MKAANVYGFEKLCDISLNDKQTKDIQNCDKSVKEVNPLWDWDRR